MTTALPPLLERHVEELRFRGLEIEVMDDGSRFYVIIHSYGFPEELYRPAATDLMVMTDFQYPVSGMDMFWTDPVVRKLDGSFPQSAEQVETYVNRQWQRWSWHYSGWDPACHSIHTHLEVVRERIRTGA